MAGVDPLVRVVRALGGFVRRHSRTLLADAVALAALAAGLLVAVHLFGVPSWLYPAGLLVGAVGYALVADWWGAG